jgi:hypothetical protein
MRFVWNEKDGGGDSLVWAYGFESKRFGSVLLLRFKRGSREAFHSHAFNCYSWLLCGRLYERFYNSSKYKTHNASWRPFKTYKTDLHKVAGLAKNSWLITLRGRWEDTWLEVNENGLQELTHKRKVVQTLDRNA